MELHILALPDTVLERWLMVAMKTRLIFLVCLLIVLILYRHRSPLLLVPVESLFLCSALGVPPLEGTKIFFTHYPLYYGHKSLFFKGNKKGNRLPDTEISTKTPEIDDF